MVMSCVSLQLTACHSQLLVICGVWSQLNLICFAGGFTTRVVKEYFHLDIARLLCRYLIHVYLSNCFARCVKGCLPYITVNTNSALLGSMWALNPLASSN